MKLEIDGTGLEAIYPQYKIQLLRYLFKGYPITSGEAYTQLQSDGFDYSRASVIMALNEFVDEGISTYTPRSGKGGYHRVYKIALSPNDFEAMIIRRTLKTLQNIWPDNYDLSVIA